MIEASIITTCKGRKPQFVDTVTCMIEQRGVEYEVIVVDYGDPDHVWQHMVTEVDFDNRGAVCVTSDVKQFNLNRARNFGAKWARGNILAFVDADVFISAQWLWSAVEAINKGCDLVTRGGHISGITGTFAVTKAMYERVRGFDESLQGWGHDEVDFFKRCRCLGTGCMYTPTLVHAIAHTDELRTTYYEEKDKRVSQSKNAAQAAADRIVNPDGYAVGSALYYRYPDSPFVG